MDFNTISSVEKITTRVLDKDLNYEINEEDPDYLQPQIPDQVEINRNIVRREPGFINIKDKKGAGLILNIAKEYVLRRIPIANTNSFTFWTLGPSGYYYYY